MFAFKTSNWFHTKENLIRSSNTSNYLQSRQVNGFTPRKTYNIVLHLLCYVFSSDTSNYLQSRQVGLNGFSPMRIFQVMMNGSEQWNDSMSIDETRMK